MGYGATEAYLPSQQIAIAVAVTFAPEAFDAQGAYANASDTLFRSIGSYLAPNDAPPFTISAMPKSSSSAFLVQRNMSDIIDHESILAGRKAFSLIGLLISESTRAHHVVFHD